MASATLMTREYAIPPQNGINLVFAGSVAAGDWLFCIVVTSDLLHKMGAPQGPPTNGWTLRQTAEALNWGNGYVWTAQATANWSGNFTIPITQLGNTGAREAMGWVWGFDQRSSGLGNTVFSRFSGAAGTTLTTQRDNSQILMGCVDWNAGAFTNGTESYRVPAGNIVAPVRSYGVHTGAANWAYGRYPDVGVAGDKLVGISNPTNWKSTILAVEVLSDWTAPGAVSNLNAILLTETSARVTWTAASENVGVTRYIVYDYGVQIADLASNVFSFDHTGLAPTSTHQYTVRALDANGNLGGVLDSKTVYIPAPSVNKAFLGASKPSLRLGTNLVTKLYQGSTQVWP